MDKSSRSNFFYDYVISKEKVIILREGKPIRGLQINTTMITNKATVVNKNMFTFHINMFSLYYIFFVKLNQ